LSKLLHETIAPGRQNFKWKTFPSLDQEHRWGIVVNAAQAGTVEFCHPEGSSIARRIWLVLKALTQVLRVAQDDKQPEAGAAIMSF
jgi:hypothetical protein